MSILCIVFVSFEKKLLNSTRGVASHCSWISIWFLAYACFILRIVAVGEVLGPGNRAADFVTGSQVGHTKRGYYVTAPKISFLLAGPLALAFFWYQHKSRNTCNSRGGQICRNVYLSLVSDSGQPNTVSVIGRKRYGLWFSAICSFWWFGKNM